MIRVYLGLVAALVFWMALGVQAAPGDLYYMTVLGNPSMKPMPIFAVKLGADGRVSSSMDIEMYQFEDGVGARYLGVVSADVVRDTEFEFVMQTPVGVAPQLTLTVDRTRAFSTAPLGYAATVVGGIVGVDPKAILVTRQWNPEFPKNDQAVGVMLESVIQGRLGHIRSCHSLLSAP